MATRTLTFTQTTIGKKVLMATTGLFMFGFVIAHMVGNLQAWPALGGEKALVHYAKFLRSMPSVLWAARLILLACLAVHVWAAIELLLRNWKASKALTNRYAKPAPAQASTIASRTMIFTGPLLFAYLIYHLGHLTWGFAHSQFLHGSENVFRNVVSGFSSPIHSGIYVLAMIALGGHLLHGVWSMFQTAGFNSVSWTDRIRAGVMAITGVIVLANISIPLGVLAGAIK